MRDEGNDRRPVRVAAVVVNYRTPDLVVRSLQTLVAELDRDRDLAVVVDNGSGDGSAQKVRAEIAERGWRGVRLIESPTNAGFSAGNNLGIRSANAHAYFLLNSDALVRPGAVKILTDTLRSDPTIGIASPRLEWPDGTPQISCFRRHTPWSELIAASRTGPIRNLLRRWDVPISVCDEPFEPDWTSFAAVLIRREVLDQVGLLDEGFFMYYEDVDYCRRVREQGWKICHEPRARVVHLRGGSFPLDAMTDARRRRPRYYYTSRSRCFRNAFGRRGLFAANALWTLGRGIAWLRESLGEKRPHTVDRELHDVWRG